MGDLCHGRSGSSAESLSIHNADLGFALQIENAAQIAFNPSSDQSLQYQAFDFLERLRQDKGAWQPCLSLLLRSPRAADVVRHVSLDVINAAVSSHQLDAQALSTIRNAIMDYLSTNYMRNEHSNIPDTVAFQNKLAQTLTYLFRVAYPNDWTTFFRDVNATSNAHFYLRVLISIHDEIAEVLNPRFGTEQKVDNELKDLIRQRDASFIVDSWHQILLRREDVDLEAFCFATISRWIIWTDISLVVNDTLLDLVFEILLSTTSGDTDQERFRKYHDTVNRMQGTLAASSFEDIGIRRRNAALEAVTEILSKKMSPNDKLELIRILRVEDILRTQSSSPGLADFRGSSKYDTDLAENVAKLVNNVVEDVAKSLGGAHDDASLSKGLSSLRTFLPHTLRFFSDEYDEVSSTVIPCLTDLLTFFRKASETNQAVMMESKAMLPVILEAIFAKMKYDDTTSWSSEDPDEFTDEAEFQELRRKLSGLQKFVANTDELLWMESVTSLVGKSLDPAQAQHEQQNWRNIEAALYEMYLFGDLALKGGSLYNRNKLISPAAEKMATMLSSFVELNVDQSSHPAVQLQAMEIYVRYWSYFDANPQHINRTLERFVYIIHTRHVRVQARSWYCFQRMVKHLRTHISADVAEVLIQNFAELLPIKAEVQEAATEDLDSDDHPDDGLTHKLHLYEAVGSICSAPLISVARQLPLMQSVLTPLLGDIQYQVPLVKQGNQLAVVQAHHLIMALGTLARGYSDWVPAKQSTHPPPSEISDAFQGANEVVLQILESTKEAEIRTASRFAFSRFIGVLGNRILPQLPRWIEGLLAGSSTKDELAFFLRLLDQVVFGFKSEIFEILNSLLTPLLQRVFNGFSETTLGTDDEIQLAELKREYLNLLLVILNNDLGPVLLSEGKSDSPPTSGKNKTCLYPHRSSPH